jgi:hypothetical protein
MKTLIQSNTLGVVKNTIGVAALLLLAVLDTGQKAQAQTLLLQLKASNYNPTTGFWTNSVGPNAQAITPYPTLTAHATPNGSPAVVFNGADPMTLASSLSDGGNGFTVFAYAKPASGAGPYALMGGGSSPGNGSFEYRIFNGKQDALRQSTQDLGSETTALSTTAFSLIDATASTSGGAFRLNGVADGTSSAASANFSPPISAVGGRTGTSGGGENFNGSISEIDVYSGILSPAQISSVEAQLTASYITTGPALIIGLAAVSPTNTVDAGSFVTLSAPNSGAVITTTFRWQTDNGTGGSSFANISGATTTNYILDTTHLADSGPTTYEYQLIGTPVSGNSVTSAPVSLTVNAASAPTISQDTTPNPANGTIGGNFTFSASFTGTLPIHYQWQVSPDGGTTVANIAGATNTTLVLNNLQLSQNGLYYSLQATNTVSSYVLNSAWVPLNVQALTPLVQLIATNYNPSAGSWTDSSGNGNNATFGGVTGGSPALPTLVPFVTPNGGSAVNFTAAGGAFNLNSPLDPSVGYTVFAYVMPSNVTGRHALTGGTVVPIGSGALEYDIYNTNQDYLQEYNTDVAHGHALVSTTSFSLVDLAVNSAGAVFRINGTNDAVVAGATFSASIGLIGNNHGGGDTFLGQIAEIDIYSGALSSLQISNIEAQLTSNYVSVAGITIGAASVSPTNNTFAGNPITLFAPELGGTGTTAYRWQTDNGSGGTSFSDISGATSTNYALNTASLANSGTGPITYEYQLIGTPLGGLSVTGAPVTLTVQPPSSPQLVTDTTPISGTEGGNATFSASFVGNLPIKYQWQVSTDGGNTAANIAGATNNTLLLSNLLLSQNGLNYRLVASNAIAPYLAESTWNALSVAALTPLVQFVATNYDPSSGVWTDSSPNNNTATYAGFNNASVPLPALLSGVTPNGGPAVNISNGGGMFSLATPLDPSSGYTIFAYVMPSVVNSGNLRYALTGGNGAGNSTGALQYGFYAGHQNYLNEYSGSEQASGTAGISTNAFSLIDLAVNASGVSFRLNLVADGTAAGATFPSPIAQLGNNQGGGDGFVGDISEIDIYGGVLSASQIKNIESQLAANYGISAASLPKVTNTVTAHSLKLSWPADHTGWTLEAQTNSAHVGIGTNWVPVASSTTTNSVVIPIVPGNADVFYRLQY